MTKKKSKTASAKKAKKPAKVAKAKKPKKKKIEVRRASIPAGMKLDEITLADAVKYLSLPRDLGMHPDSDLPIMANTGRFGPYVAHNGEFRSIKQGDPYTITLDEAVTLINTPKQPPRGVEIIRELGPHPKTGKQLVLYKSKQGLFLKKGLRRIYLPESQDADAFTAEEAAEYLK